jgi:hypothetical protein
VRRWINLAQMQVAMRRTFALEMGLINRDS